MKIIMISYFQLRSSKRYLEFCYCYKINLLVQLRVMKYGGLGWAKCVACLHFTLQVIHLQNLN